MKKLINEVAACTVCQSFLPNPPRPVFSVSRHSKILIIGQAPGQKVQNSGVPWSDKSGNELRRWLGVGEEEFYNTNLFGLMPMGFCFPGKGANGDLPPRTECAPLWHHKFRAEMKEVKLTLLIGQYSQKFYLEKKFNLTLTDTVKKYDRFLPKYFPLVHPSPRNKIWQKKNPWFESELLPELRKIISTILVQ
jgi:uracil-DNA glycosylase